MTPKSVCCGAEIKPQHISCGDVYPICSKCGVVCKTLSPSISKPEEVKRYSTADCILEEEKVAQFLSWVKYSDWLKEREAREKAEKRIKLLESNDRLVFDKYEALEAKLEEVSNQRDSYAQLAAQNQGKIEAAEKELIEAKDVTYMANQILALESKNSRMRQALADYGRHETECVAGQWRKGEPTPEGGYRTLFGYGINEGWYQGDEVPLCTCGLKEAMKGGEK